MIVGAGFKKHEIDGSEYNTDVVLSAEQLDLLHRTVLAAGECACTVMRIEFTGECPPLVWTVVDEAALKGSAPLPHRPCGPQCTKPAT